MINSFEVITRAGCILIKGAVPVNMLTGIVKLAPEGAVMDPDVARMAGATFAFGLPDDLAELRKTLVSITPAKPRAGLSDAAAEWLAHGEHGLSSCAIFFKMTGINPNPRYKAIDHPHDPDDLGRCRLLLEQVPEFASRIGEMAEVSPCWAGLVREWANLCLTMDEEAPQWREEKGRMPMTYAAMQWILWGDGHE